MNFDNRFYQIQTKIRSVYNPIDITALCDSEALRIGSILRPYLVIIKQMHEPLVLDAPCGYGNMLYLYKKEGLNYEGFDLDQNQVDLAKSIDLNAVAMNIFDIKCNNIYSAISSFDFIEHIEKNMALDAIEKFYHMLQPDGYLFLRTPSGDSPFGLRDYAEDPTHKWIGTSNSIASLLSIAGFKNIEVYEDWPIPKNLKIIRLTLSVSLRFLTKTYYWLMGFGWPRCLSSSMIIVAQK